MKKLTKVVFIMLVIIIYGSFVAFAQNEGMSPVRYTTNEQIWKYHTGEEDDHGYLMCMTNQWKQVWDDWYYFGEDGWSKQNTWAQIDSKWYYFDSFSRMLHDTTTPDGYTVGSDGAWVKDGQVVVEADTSTTEATQQAN